MKNKLKDLNDHLFAQLERLGNESLKGEELDREIKRAQSMGGVANQVIQLGRLALDAEVARSEYRLLASPLECLTNG